MKAIIFAGGFGTRISEESHLKPKPMIEIGGKPILWHIMKTYSAHNINDFIICCGYKGQMIKEYFSNYRLHMSDVTFDMRQNKMEVHNHYAEPWRVTLVNTGEDTMTGGRLKRIASFLEKDEDVCLTYGDGLSNVNITDLICFHKNHGCKATITVVNPPARFGSVLIDGSNRVVDFKEKPADKNTLINGGFFVLSSDVINLIEGDQTIWEKNPLEKLAQSKQIYAFYHNGFWQPMDTLRDKVFLESLWKEGNPPWKVWE